MSEITVVPLGGAPRERGRQHGEALQDSIEDLYGAFIEMMDASGRERLHDPSKVSEAALTNYAQQHASHIRQFAPDLFEEMEGIAEGAGIPSDHVLVLNCVAEIRRLRSTGVIESVERNRNGLGNGQQGCTCYAVFGRAAQDREVYLGQTYDIEPFWTPVVFHIESAAGEPEQLVVGHPGILAEFGINAAGISFVASAIMVNDQRVGVPAPIIGRNLLQQRRLSDAIDAIVQARRTIGIHYVVAAPFGVADVETSATRDSVQYLQDDIFVCANHTHSPEIEALSLGNSWTDTYIREGRMTQLLNARAGRITLNYLKESMRDHADYPNSICSHVPEGSACCESRAAVIFKPVEGLMLLSDGPPCEHPFQPFHMKFETAYRVPVAT